MQAASETTLASVRRSDASTRDANGNLQRLPPAEHMRRAAIYLSVRAFAEARDHWQSLIDNYPAGSARGGSVARHRPFLFSRQVYEDGYAIFNELVQKYRGTKEEREALNFSAASLLRMGQFTESAARYVEYVHRFPNGERIDTAHLNIIDTLREANRPDEALTGSREHRQRFAGSATETNAMFGALRLHISEGELDRGIRMAESIVAANVCEGGADLALRSCLSQGLQPRTGRQKRRSVFGLSGGARRHRILLRLARKSRLAALAGQDTRGARDRTRSARELRDRHCRQFVSRAVSTSDSECGEKTKLDPRFILALIKQESVFKPLAKSPAGARGLLQLTMDAAHKYAPAAGVNFIARESTLPT